MKSNLYNELAQRNFNKKADKVAVIMILTAVYLLTKLY